MQAMTACSAALKGKLTKEPPVRLWVYAALQQEHLWHQNAQLASKELTCSRSKHKSLMDMLQVIPCLWHCLVTHP